MLTNYLELGAGSQANIGAPNDGRQDKPGLYLQPACQIAY